MTRIFVYGTLKRGYRAHHLIDHSDNRFIGEALSQPRYHIYDLGGFPGMKENLAVDGGVRGEIYEVNDTTLQLLDRYECVDSGLFERREIELEDGTTALAYFFGGWIQDMHARRIEEGVWI